MQPPSSVPAIVRREMLTGKQMRAPSRSLAMLYDVIIVGARCAGSPTAMLLSQRGYRVLCVDKATFPSPTICSHLIQPPGVARLRKWGLLDRLRPFCFPPIRTGSIDFGPVQLVGSLCPSSKDWEAYSIHRGTLDWILLEAAVEAGAEFRPGFTVQELIVEDGAVKGVRGRTREGGVFSEYARVTIGADGSHSAVARLLKAADYNVVEPLTCNYYSYWSGVPVSGAEWFARPGRFWTAAPASDGLTVISVLKTRAEFREFRADIEAGFFETLDLAPSFAERVRAGRREEPFAGTADTTNYFRHPYGPGWALIGDAGYCRDAITSQGITDAFRDADMIANAVDRGLSGKQPIQDALADFHRVRDAAVTPLYRFTCELARLTPPTPERMALFRALRANQSDTDQLLGTFAGTVPISEFYAPDNVRRILRQASACCVCPKGSAPG